MAKLTNPCTHGASNETLDNLTVRGVFAANAIIGPGLHASTFGVDADGSTTVSNTRVKAADSQIMVFPTNAEAGLLLRTKTCWISNIVDGSFIFNVSATAAGAPAGTETMAYLTSNPTNVDET